MALRKVLLGAGCMCWTALAAAQLPPLRDPLVVDLGGPQQGQQVFTAVTDPAQFPGAGVDAPPNLPPIPQSWLASAWMPQPRFEFRAEASFLKPKLNRSRILANQLQPNADFNNVVLNPVYVESNSEYTAAPRFTLEFHMNEFRSFEFTGWFMDGPRQRNVMMGQTDFPLGLGAGGFTGGPMINQPFGFPFDSEEGRFDWTFETQNAELNYLHHFIFERGLVSDAVLGIGGRFFGCIEEVNVRFLDELLGLPGGMNVDTDNYLYGPQLIGKFRLQSPWRRFRLLSEFKAGLMANATHVETRLITNVEVARNRISRTNFAPLFEGSFAFEVCVNRHLTVFGGYELFFAGRLSRASKQLHPDLNTFVGPQKENSDLFMHGPRAGLVFHY